jgi:hypothetical protein
VNTPLPDTTKPGWLARLLSSWNWFGQAPLPPPRMSRNVNAEIAGNAEEKSWVFSAHSASKKFSALHYHRKILQFVLQNRQSAAGHFHTASGVERSLGRYSVTTSHQEHL